MAPKAPRRQERIFAFKVLYGLTFTAPSAPTLADLQSAFLQSPDRPENQEPGFGFAWELVYGVWTQQTAIDAGLARLSDNWRVDRMGRVELTILRLAIYELAYRGDVPPKVVLNEAIELSRAFGDEKSRSFVNGVLDAAAKTHEAGTLLQNNT